MDKRIKPKTKSVLNIGVILLFLSLISVVIFLFLKLRFAGQKEEENLVVQKIDDDQKLIITDWEEYTNEEFLYKISHPKLLYTREYKDVEGYLNFVRFEETAYSLGKGVAVGIRNNTLEEEVENIKNDFKKFESAKLSKEQKIKLDNYDAVLLEYLVTDGAEGENRSIVIISKDDKTYSLSTVPEQIDKVLTSFIFL